MEKFFGEVNIYSSLLCSYLSIGSVVPYSNKNQNLSTHIDYICDCYINNPNNEILDDVLRGLKLASSIPVNADILMKFPKLIIMLIGIINNSTTDNLNLIQFFYNITSITLLNPVPYWNIKENSRINRSINKYSFFKKHKLSSLPSILHSQTSWNPCDMDGLKLPDVYFNPSKPDSISLKIYVDNKFSLCKVLDYIGSKNGVPTERIEIYSLIIQILTNICLSVENMYEYFSIIDYTNYFIPFLKEKKLLTNSCIKLTTTNLLLIIFKLTNQEFKWNYPVILKLIPIYRDIILDENNTAEEQKKAFEPFKGKLKNNNKECIRFAEAGIMKIFLDIFMDNNIKDIIDLYMLYYIIRIIHNISVVGSCVIYNEHNIFEKYV
jgi:hypothetical protein